MAHKLFMALPILLMVATSPGRYTPGSPASFSRSPKLQVFVASPEGTPLGGATLTLCPEQGGDKPAGCLTKVTNPKGEASFEKIPPTRYQLKGELSGFASTMVFPLSIAASDPVAPDRVVLLLNPVCWHC